MLIARVNNLVLMLASYVKPSLKSWFSLATQALAQAQEKEKFRSLILVLVLMLASSRFHGEISTLMLASLVKTRH